MSTLKLRPELFDPISDSVCDAELEIDSFGESYEDCVTFNINPLKTRGEKTTIHSFNFSLTESETLYLMKFLKTRLKEFKKEDHK